MSATIEADPALPIIRITRDFAASPAQVFRAHTDQELFAQWVGPAALTTRIEHWDATTGGRWSYTSIGGGQEYSFHGSFHDVRPNRIVQTFTYDAEPDGVALQTLWFDQLRDGRCRLRAQSLMDSFAERDAWLRSGVEIGVDQGYTAIERMISDGVF